MTIGVFENQIEFSNLCNEIAKIDKRIEIVTILNHRGRVIEIKIRNNAIWEEVTPQKKEMFFMECVLQDRMNRDHDVELGKVKCVIHEREKFLLYSFGIFDHIILVISTPVLDPFGLKNKIVDIISDSKIDDSKKENF